MRIAVLAVATNIHTRRWVNALAERHHTVVLITQQPPLEGDYPRSVEIEVLPFKGPLAYVLNAPILRRIFRRSKADLLHVHYAGGYGTTVLLSGIKDYLISVWGGDVYDVPDRSSLHRLLVVLALKRAGRITSTSHVMAEQVKRLGVRRGIDVVPFGVDTTNFTPLPGPPKSARLVVGTVKTLKSKYGIDTLIAGFAEALNDPGFSALDPVLQIYGEGPEHGEYLELSARLGIQSRVEFAGHIRHEQVPAALQKFDIYVAVSRDDSESFGVAIIEASACALPVVVSDAGGLPEVVEDGVTGFVIPRNDPSRLSFMLRKLGADQGLRMALGAAGRARVADRYEWADCVEQMIAIYGEVAASRASNSDASSRAREATGEQPTRFRQELPVPKG